jgi:hypothetical protein
VTDIEDLLSLVGNEQLVAIWDKAADIESRIKDWKAAQELAQRRLPVWEVAEQLARHAAGLPGAQSHLEQLEAIRVQRLLLDPTDSISPIRAALAGLLREAVGKAYEAHAGAHEAGMVNLHANEAWKKLDDSDKEVILVELGLSIPVEPDVSSDEALGRYLNARSIKATLTERDAIPGRIQQAIERAAKLLEPKVQVIAVERSTLRTKEDVDAWLDRQKETLIDGLTRGPVLVN